MRTTHRILLVASLAVASCRDRQLREWTPQDHDPDGGSFTESAPSTGGDPMAAAQALFNAQCASCHGAEGHGDGPMAAMFRPADLTDATLQAQRTDDDLANAIVRGKGRMPAFGAQLRPEAVPLLVRLIRSWRR